ncbi:MAG: ADOP family duplicated permease [Vicinamibacterales bacterium]
MKRPFRPSLLRAIGLPRKRSADRDFSAELESHLEMHIADNIRAGMTPEEARRQALIVLGGVEQTKERYREARRAGTADQLRQDLRYAGRGLARNPGFALAAILTLGLGIGANAAVLAVAYGVLMRPLPYADAARLVVLNLYFSDGGDLGFSPSQVPEWLTNLRTVEDAAAYASRPLTLRGNGQSTLVTTAFVTDRFFRVLGVPAAYGRTPADDRTTAVVSRRGIGELIPDTVGDQLTISDGLYTIGAVMPSSFAFPTEETRAWIPAPLLNAASKSEDTGYFRIVARLKPGVTQAEAQEDAKRLVRETNLKGSYATVSPLGEQATAAARPVLRVSLVAGALVLLVACANVTTLFLGRSATRRREVAARIALGASPFQLARGLFVETLIIAVAASIVGVALAAAALRAYVDGAAGALPGLEAATALTIDAPILLGIAALTVASAIVCGALPAWHVARADSRPFLRATTVLTPTAWRVRAALMVVQIALSVVLLVGAGLLTQSVIRLLSDDPGFTPAGALEAKIVLSDRVLLGAGRETFVRELLDRVRVLPGVQHAGLGSNLPPRTPPITIAIRLIDESEGVNELRFMKAGSATPGQLRALGVYFVRGRDFTEADGTSGEAVILSESTARFFFRDGSDPIGKTISSLPRIVQSPGRPVVVGVVSDIKYEGLDVPAGSSIYLPWNRRPIGTAYLVVRTAQDPVTFASAIRRIVSDLDPSVPVPEIRTLEEVMADSISGRRLRLFPAVGFGVLALLVTLMGLLATLSRAVAERHQELAIRSALGASPTQLVWMIMAKGFALTAVGIAAGLGLARAVGQSLSHLLFRTSPYDPMTFLSVAMLVIFGSSLAMYVAARKAARTDPLAALKLE